MLATVLRLMDSMKHLIRESKACWSSMLQNGKVFGMTSSTIVYLRTMPPSTNQVFQVIFRRATIPIDIEMLEDEPENRLQNHIDDSHISLNLKERWWQEWFRFVGPYKITKHLGQGLYC